MKYKGHGEYTFNPKTGEVFKRKRRHKNFLTKGAFGSNPFVLNRKINREEQELAETTKILQDRFPEAQIA